MYQWEEAVQKMIDWVEDNLTESPSLLDMSKQIGYSPFYCSSQFHRVAGMTLKQYIAGRKLCLAALEIRDTDQRILDIAVKFGFSSQQALTRAFVYAYGCTPAAYRKNPRPIPISLKKAVLFPEHYIKKEDRTMNKTVLTEANVRVEYIPAHRFLGIWDKEVQSYFPFWNRHNCEEVTGTIDSLSNVMHPVLPCHTGGWFWQDGQRGYSYGMGLLPDYDKEVPEGFQIKEYPGSYYLVFYHPVYDFLKDCDEVFDRVEKLAWNFDPGTMGFKWNESVCQDYQRQMPETIGYEVLRPVRSGY